MSATDIRKCTTLFLTALLPAVLAAPGQAYAQRASKTGAVEIGTRAGVEFPSGSLAKSDNSSYLAENISYFAPVAFPFWLDLGYRYRGHWLFGGFAMFAPTRTEHCFTSCSGTHTRIGAQVHYHFAPENKIDGFIGVGVSYQWLTFSFSEGDTARVGGAHIPGQSTTWSGFEWFHVQGGLDLKVSDNVALGPFGAMFLGEYSSQKTRFDADSRIVQWPINSSLHQWLVLGFRVVADL